MERSLNSFLYYTEIIGMLLESASLSLPMESSYELNPIGFLYQGNQEKPQWQQEENFGLGV